MVDYKGILRLSNKGYSLRQIAASVVHSHHTVDYSAVRKTLIRQKENIVPRQGKRQSAVGTQ